MIAESLSALSSLSGEFWWGAGTVVLVMALRALVALFSYPSLSNIAKKASKPFDKIIGDTSSPNIQVILFGYEAAGEHPAYSVGIPDDAYYVSRVEAFLRLAQIPYTKAASQGGSENPRGKVPFCNIQGQMLDESSKIITALKNQFCLRGTKASAKKDPDDKLTDQQRAQSRLIRNTLEGSLYWVSCHFLFHTEAGRKVFREHLVSQGLPPVIRDLVVAMVYRNMYKNMYGQGIARMPESAIVQRGEDDFQALSTLLGQNQYMLGTDEPTGIDADCYAMLAPFFFEPRAHFQLVWVDDMRTECPNLVKYVERMRSILYPELK